MVVAFFIFNLFFERLGFRFLTTAQVVGAARSEPKVWSGSGTAQDTVCGLACRCALKKICTIFLFFGYNIGMRICKIEGPVGLGVYKIICDEGAAFYIRPEYLPTISFDEIFVDAEFCDERLEELLDAGLAGAAEFKAIEYLARAEQCRFKLTQKLLEKGHTKAAVNMALDFLESKNYLSDERFSRAWLNTRKINHYEGRTRLSAELAQRGISREVAAASLDEFFTENDEEEICKKAVEKLKRRGKSGEKLLAALVTAGFSYKMANALCENE